MVILMGIFLLGYAASPASGSDLISEKEKQMLSRAVVEKLAQEFRSLRTIPGHFVGGKWNVDVDQWMGHKHKLMLELGSSLTEGEYDKAEIINLLGSPDQTVQPGDHLFNLIITLSRYDASTAKSYKFLVYYWRGAHDFLFFTCQDGQIIGSDWCYAGD
jgi:hypothetical protein